MRMSRPAVSSSKTRVVVLTADAHFEQLVRQTFSVSPQVELSCISQRWRARAIASIWTARPSL